MSYPLHTSVNPIKIRIHRLPLVRLLFAAVVLLSSPNAWGQEDGLQAIQNKFGQYQPKVLQEKMFLHIDKGFYLAGEILWFKLYAVEGATHSQLDLSKVAYIEVLDRNQKPVLQTKVAMANGLGNGSLVLPMALPSDNYKIRGYTNWMKNFSPDFYFEKTITIVNTEESQEAVAQAEKEQTALDVQFFPEGGNLVQGLESRVGVRAVGANGKGVDFTGAILNEKNDTVARFEPLTFGIGSFLFKPEAGGKYKAVIRPKGQKPLVLDMPKIYEQGYTMRVTEAEGDRLQVQVATTGLPGAQQVYLFAHTRQLQKIALAAPVKDGKASFAIDKAKLGEGITHFTLFNNAQQPVSERLYFKRPQQVLDLSAVPDQNQYASRQKVEVEVAAQRTGAPVAEANLSVGVYLLDSFQAQSQEDILSYFYLSSDLQGTIESPSYYFSATNSEVAQAADNLMLTHGWRRFKWEEVLQNKLPSFQFAPEQEGLSITAQLVDKGTNAPLSRILTFLSLPDSVSQFYGGLTNSAGKIRFNLKDFYGKKEIVVRAGDQKKDSHTTFISNPFSEEYSSGKMPPLSLASSLQDQLLRSSIYNQVQRYYQPNSYTQYKSTGKKNMSSFYGTPDKQYVLAEYTKFPTVGDVIREYIPEVLLQKREGVPHLLVLDKRRQTHFTTDPLILLDGVPFFRTEEIIGYNTAQIKKIEVVTHKYFLGPMAFTGILNISTYKADLSGIALDPNVIIFDYEGLQRQREFYTPVYETKDQRESKLPDFRNLLYWAPTLTTNAQGKTQFSFFTSDQKGKYIGVVQGMTKGGVMGTQTFIFEVRSPL